MAWLTFLCCSPQAELDIELHRNNFYAAKKKVFSDFAVARAARVVALLVEARHEATSLRVMQDSLHSLNEQVRAINDTINLRSAFICLMHCRPLVYQGQDGLSRIVHGNIPKTSLSPYRACCFLKGSVLVMVNNEDG